MVHIHLDSSPLVVNILSVESVQNKKHMPVSHTTNFCSAVALQAILFAVKLSASKLSAT